MTIKMKELLAVAMVVISTTSGSAQGVFFGSNVSARTRVGSSDGPLAGTNIFGQWLAGSSSLSLTPVGMTDFHKPGGVFFVGNVTVPGVAPYNWAYVQLVAWDSTLWGISLEAVPADQFGRTDIVRVYLTTGQFPDIMTAPHFNQLAVVPIPEPSVWALWLVGAAVLSFGVRRRTRPRALTRTSPSSKCGPPSPP